MNHQSCNTSVTMLDIGRNCFDPALLDSNNIDHLDNNSPLNLKESVYNLTQETPLKEKED